MDCYCLLKYKLKTSMVTAERTFPQVSSTSFSIVAFLAPGTLVSSHTFLCLHIYVHSFLGDILQDLLRYLSPTLPKLGLEFLFQTSKHSAPFQDTKLHCHELPTFPFPIRAVLFFYSACPVYYLTLSKMFPAMIILKLRATNQNHIYIFFPLRSYFTHFYNYLSHFDLTFTCWPGTEVTLLLLLLFC